MLTSTGVPNPLGIPGSHLPALSAGYDGYDYRYEQKGAPPNKRSRFAEGDGGGLGSYVRASQGILGLNHSVSRTRTLNPKTANQLEGDFDCTACPIPHLSRGDSCFFGCPESRLLYSGGT